jgi:hypothetical protein
VPKNPKKSGLIDYLVDKITNGGHEAVASLNARARALLVSQAYEKHAKELAGDAKRATVHHEAPERMAGPLPTYTKVDREDLALTKRLFYNERDEIATRIRQKYEGNLWRADNATAKVVAEIAKLDEWEFIRQLTGGQKIIRAGVTLSDLSDQIMTAVGTNMVGLVDAVMRVPDENFVELHRLRDTAVNLDGYLHRYNVALNEAIEYAAVMLDREAWNAVVDQNGSKLGKGVIDGVFLVLSGIVAAGTAAAAGAPIRGIAPIGATVQAALGMAQDKARQLERDRQRGKLRKELGPNFPYEEMNRKVTAMAERVAAKQKQNVKTVMNMVSIGGSEVPGWPLIRTAVESIIDAYYNARVTMLKRALHQADILEQVEDFAKEDAREAFLDISKHQIAEGVGEQLKEKIAELSEEHKEEFAAKAREVIGETTKHEGHGAGAAEAGKEAAKEGAEATHQTAGQVVGGIAENIGIALAENLAIMLVGKIIEQILASLPIEMAEIVTGYDIKDMRKLLESRLDSIAKGQTDESAYPAPTI